MNRIGLTAAGMTAVMVLTGCAGTPMGPTVRAMPPAGKSYEAFQADNAYCKDAAAREVKGEADSANDRAVGTALIGAALGAGLGAVAGGGRGAAVGAAAGGTAGTLVGADGSAHQQRSIQYQYNNAYEQCMTAHGDLIQQAYRPVTVVQPVYAPPPAVIYAPPPTVVYAPPPQTGYAPPAGAVAPPPGTAAPPSSGYPPPAGAVAPPANLPPPGVGPQ
jgi:uncharacterized protein YcfJ